MKKAQLGVVVTLVMSLVIVSVLLVVMYKINAATAEGYTSADTTGVYNASQYVKDAGDEIGSNLSLIAIITVFAVIIGLLTTYFIGKAMTNV